MSAGVQANCSTDTLSELATLECVYRASLQGTPFPEVDAEIDIDAEIDVEKEGSKLLEAASDGDILTVRRYLKTSFPTKIPPSVYATALTYACAGGHFATALVLIESHVNVNLIPEPGYFTPLMYAAYAACAEVQEALLQAGADPTVHIEGFTAQSLAALAIREGRVSHGPVLPCSCKD
jgi:Ankyrin repeats (3 copies)